MPSGVYERPDVWARLLEKIEVTPECWRWTGGISPTTGYGHFWYEGKTYGAHVVVAHLFFGTPLDRPRTQAIDHLCRHTWCVRPSHLDPTTMHENHVRAPRYQVTECPNGHEYTVENTYIYRGMKHCRRCHAEREAARRRRVLSR